MKFCKKSFFIYSFRRLFVGFIVFAFLLSACSPAAPIAGSAPISTLPRIPSPVKTATTRPSVLVPPATKRPLATAAPTDSISPTARPLIRRVLIISIDGLHPDAITLAPMPNLMSLIAAGAYSLIAQTIFPSTTLPSHASMLSGLCPAKHGVDWDQYLPFLGNAKGVDLFDLSHAAGLKTVMFAGKEKLVQITEPASLDIFRYIYDQDTLMAARIGEEFPLDFGLMFIHFPNVDLTGHAFGWMSTQYLEAVKHADEAVGLILQYLDQNGLRPETLVIVTADHGGHGTSHGSRAPEDMTIPWVISGPGVRVGQLNTKIQTTDTAATAAWALNLPRPVEWDGWPVFEAFGQPVQPRPIPFCN